MSELKTLYVSLDEAITAINAIRAAKAGANYAAVNRITPEKAPPQPFKAMTRAELTAKIGGGFTMKPVWDPVKGEEVKHPCILREQLKKLLAEEGGGSFNTKAQTFVKAIKPPKK